MSEEQFVEVIGKALLDPQFRKSLVGDPDNTVEGYDLTDEEMQLLKKIKLEALESLGTELEERVSRVGLNPFSVGEMSEIAAQPFHSPDKQGMKTALNNAIKDLASQFRQA